MNGLTQDTLDAIKAQVGLEIQKAWTQPGSAISGINYYNLEEGAKKLYPVITPLRNLIPRVKTSGGIQANWRAITGINTANLGAGVSFGNRAPVMSSTTQDYTAAFKAYGFEDNVQFEADFTAERFDDLKALAVEGLLRATMIGEEKLDLGGNASIALGTTPTPSNSTSTTGGTLAAATYNVICVALTFEGFQAASVAGGLPLSGNVTLADGTTEARNQGTAIKSTAASQVTTGATSTISSSVAAVNGAVAYAWFWGTAGNELLGAITTINSVLITAAATGTQNASAGFTADKSQNSLVYDGLLSLAMVSGSGALIRTQATGTAGTGTPLTSDTAGGIVEIDSMLQSFWDNYRLTPDCIWVNSQEQQNISKKILTGSASAAQRFMFTAQQGNLTGGYLARSYLNKFAMDGAAEIPIKLHPNMPAGTIMFTTSQLPYPLSNVQSVFRKLLRRDYYQIEWPIRTRKYEYGVYADGVLQHYFPPSLGVLKNVGNG